jgi:amidase
VSRLSKYGDAVGEEITTWPAFRLATAIADKQVGSRELLEAYLARIERLNPALNAVVTLDADRALAAAREADEQTAHGERRGPLHGLPTTIKDAIEVAGVRSTGGAVELRDHVPDRDAPAVARLKAAGAVVFGKTNVPRWSGDFQTYNEIFGTTNNPWARDRTPGGSSGGAAAAVAAGLTSFEVGTDIGGSVRIPSHCCGVFGLKPSYGVIPQRGYLDHVGGGLTDADINVFGPIGRDAGDLDLLLGVLAGPEPQRALAWRLELPPPRYRGLDEIRIGVWLDGSACPLDRDLQLVITGALDRLADAGAKLTEAHPPVEFTHQQEVFGRLIVAAIAPSADAEVAEALGGSHLAWLQADEERARLARIWADWFESYDLLLCPVMPIPAFPHNQEGALWDRTIDVDGATVPYVDVIQWPGLIGVVGLPAAVPPIGRTAQGLPVGVQLVAPFLRDREAVHAARLVAEVTGGYSPPPLDS